MYTEIDFTSHSVSLHALQPRLADTLPVLCPTECNFFSKLIKPSVLLWYNQFFLYFGGLVYTDLYSKYTHRLFKGF